MLNFESIIIGAGVAGMTSAIYLKRANVNILLLEKSAPGGQINMTAKIENYPGFTSIDGPSLAMNIFEQVSNLKVPYKYGNVFSIEKKDDLFLIKTDIEQYTTKTIIIATGRHPKELGLENEKNLTGRGISWCAICDGIFFKDKIVAVVGGGNSALEESLYLSDICTKVYIILRNNVFRGDKLLQDKIKQKGNIIVKYSTTIKKLVEDENKLSSLVLNNEEVLKVDGLFIYIGNIPDTSFLNKITINLLDNYIIVNENMQTNIDGIFACGDVINKDVYQISTAVGEGAKAAISVSKYLKK
ncbi:MAG: FAD-dependent oxidoreductase [Bacilli bacterium]